MKWNKNSFRERCKRETPGQRERRVVFKRESTGFPRERETKVEWVQISLLENVFHIPLNGSFITIFSPRCPNLGPSNLLGLYQGQEPWAFDHLFIFLAWSLLSL